MNRRYLKLGAALALTAVLGAACGSDEDEAAVPIAAQEQDQNQETSTTHDSMDGPMGEGGRAAESGAAELRAGLTHLLREHVYLAGAALSTAVGNGGDLQHPQ